MKSHYQTVLFLIAILLLTGSGCASVTRMLASLDIMGDGSGDNKTDESDDPVAAAAARFREPASSASYGDGSSGSRTWSSRYTSPTADTIGYGMDMGEVSSIWGEPGSVDSAGDPREGNQRWTYYSGLSSRYGLGSKRVVYFEGGKVAGWKAAQ